MKLALALKKVGAGSEDATARDFAPYPLYRPRPYRKRKLSSSGYWIFNHPEICSGDQSRISLLAPMFRNFTWMERRQRLGRTADSQASPSVDRLDTQDGHQDARPDQAWRAQQGSGTGAEHPRERLKDTSSVYNERVYALWNFADIHDIHQLQGVCVNHRHGSRSRV